MFVDGLMKEIERKSFIFTFSGPCCYVINQFSYLQASLEEPVPLE